MSSIPTIIDRWTHLSQNAAAWFIVNSSIQTYIKIYNNYCDFLSFVLSKALWFCSVRRCLYQYTNGLYTKKGNACSLQTTCTRYHFSIPNLTYTIDTAAGRYFSIFMYMTPFSLNLRYTIPSYQFGHHLCIGQPFTSSGHKNRITVIINNAILYIYNT